MQKREIGKTGIMVSEISLGCWTLGGDVDSGGMGWHGVSEKDADEAINYAVDNGVNHFDNADVYGNGKAEKMLALALGAKNKQVIIASKVGWNKNEFENAFDARNIRRQCEQSLKNLKRDTLDIYYFHNCDFGKDDAYLEGAIAEFHKLRSEGMIKAIGLSGYSADDFLRLAPRIKPDCIQSWCNIIHPDFVAEGPVSKMMKELNITFVAFNPLSRGLLTGKFSRENPPVFDKNDVRETMDEFKPGNFEKLMDGVDKLKAKFGTAGEALVRAALQYILYHETAACVIPGFRNLQQVKMNLSAADKGLSKEEYAYIKEAFL